MVAYTLALHGTQSALAVVAAHGLTDLDSFGWLPVYALWYFVPNALVTPGFVASSMVHFSYDIGRMGSLALHAAVGALCLVRGPDLAFEAMLIYLAAVHVPLHYRRCLLRGRIFGVCLAVVVTVMLLLLSKQMNSVFFFGNWLQRIAAAHIVHEFILDTRYPMGVPVKE